MARSFLSGIAMGVVVSAAGLSGLSVLTMPPIGDVNGTVDDLEVSTLPKGGLLEGALDAGGAEVYSDDIADPKDAVQQMAAPTDTTDPQDGDVIPAETETPENPADDELSGDCTSEPALEDEMRAPADAPVVDTPNAVFPDSAPDQSIFSAEDTPAVTPMTDGADADLRVDVPSPPAMDENPLDASPKPKTISPQETTPHAIATIPSADHDQTASDTPVD